MATLSENTLLGLRNRALLLVGFAGALRRSELVALEWKHLETTAEGLRVWVSQSKTDPTGKGRAVGIPYGAREESCPVRALLAWREKSRLTAGPVFPLIGRTGKIQPSALSPRAVARLVKLVAGRLGLNPEEFSAHSLRAGLATSAAAGGASERAIMNQTGQRSVKTVLGYIREGSLFRDNAAAWSGI